MYRIRTPTTGDPTRYSVRPGLNMSNGDLVGLGECDLPISIENVRITPIPGRFPFRVLTFINSSATSFATPSE